MTVGKPLRFLGATIGGWIALRTFALWPDAAVIEHAIDLIGSAPVSAATRGSAPWSHPAGRLPPAMDREAHPHGIAHRAAMSMMARHPSRAITTRSSAVSPVALAQAATIPPPLVLPPLTTRGDRSSRWQASAWLIARGGSGPNSFGGQLGASQAGARVTYAIDEAHRIAVAARIAAPLRGSGREIGIGIDWQPTRAPIHLIAEQRIAIDGGRGGPTILLVGGIGPKPILPAIDGEAYIQTGAIARDGIEGFADGAARITHAVARGDRLRFDLGIGAWGGAQRGAERLDIGPTAGLVVPVGGKAVRVTLDWRHRIAGAAAPGSGPALSIGSDF